MSRNERFTCRDALSWHLYDCETVIGGDVIVNSIVVLLILLVLSTYVCPLALLPHTHALAWVHIFLHKYNNCYVCMLHIRVYYWLPLFVGSVPNNPSCLAWPVSHTWHQLTSHSPLLTDTDCESAVNWNWVLQPLRVRAMEATQE